MTTAQIAPAARSRLLPPETGRAGFADALRSEFTKIRSTRSTYWTLLALIVVCIGIGALSCAGTAANPKGISPAGFDGTQQSLAGLYVGQLVIAALGALTITSEYSTGMIRTSLSVMPRRRILYAAKAAVFTAIALVVAFLTSFAAFFIGQALLSSTHASATLSQPNVLRAVTCAALYVALCGLFSFGLGMILRSTAGAMATAYGLLFLVPQLAKALPSGWYADVVRWLPGGDVVNAITSTQTSSLSPNMFSAWGEFAVFGAYTVVLLAVGAVLFARRDA